MPKLAGPFLNVHILHALLIACVFCFLIPGAQAADYTIEVNKGRLIRLDRPAASVIVADPTIADIQVVSPTLVYINGRSTGETSIFAVDRSDNEILNGTVTVTHNLSKLNKAMKALLPGSNVEFETMGGALVMKGQADSPLAAEDLRRLATPFLRGSETLVNMLRVNGSDQVLLKVRVAEVSRNELKRFGIHLESILDSGNFIFGFAQGRDVIDATSTFARSGDDNSLFINYSHGNDDINGVIDALEDDGLVTVLAEPNLTAVSGRPASFLAGGEFPIPVVGQDGQVTIEYRPFGVSLAFTPQVLSKEKISLTVSPEVSTLSQIGAVEIQGFSVPSLATRRASTTVELGSGQSFAIAGLMRSNTGNDVSKFPWLGDVPILGALFRSSEFRNEQSELVIIVTPYVVDGNTTTALSTPVDDYVPVTDLGRVLFGKMYEEHEPLQGEQTAALEKTSAQVDVPQLQGPAGYVLK